MKQLKGYKQTVLKPKKDALSVGRIRSGFKTSTHLQRIQQNVENIVVQYQPIKIVTSKAAEGIRMQNGSPVLAQPREYTANADLSKLPGPTAFTFQNIENNLQVQRNRTQRVASALERGRIKGKGLKALKKQAKNLAVIGIASPQSPQSPQSQGLYNTHFSGVQTAKTQVQSKMNKGESFSCRPSAPGQKDNKISNAQMTQATTPSRHGVFSIRNNHVNLRAASDNASESVLNFHQITKPPGFPKREPSPRNVRSSVKVPDTKTSMKNSFQIENAVKKRRVVAPILSSSALTQDTANQFGGTWGQSLLKKDSNTSCNMTSNQNIGRRAELERVQQSQNSNVLLRKSLGNSMDHMDVSNFQIPNPSRIGQHIRDPASQLNDIIENLAKQSAAEQYNFVKRPKSAILHDQRRKRQKGQKASKLSHQPSMKTENSQDNVGDSYQDKKIVSQGFVSQDVISRELNKPSQSKLSVDISSKQRLSNVQSLEMLDLQKFNDKPSGNAKTDEYYKSREEAILNSQRKPNQNVIYQSIQNGPILIQINEEDKKGKQKSEDQSEEDKKLESLTSKDFNINDKDALIQFYQAQAAQDTFRQQSPGLIGKRLQEQSGDMKSIQQLQDFSPIVVEVDVNKSLHLRDSMQVSPDEGSQKGKGGLTKVHSRITTKRRQSEGLTHNYVEESKIKKYQDKLNECQGKFKMLNRRFQNNSTSQSSKLRYLMHQIEKNQKQIEKVVNTGSFKDCNLPDDIINYDLVGVQNVNYCPVYQQESQNQLQSAASSYQLIERQMKNNNLVNQEQQLTTSGSSFGKMQLHQQLNDPQIKYNVQIIAQNPLTLSDNQIDDNQGQFQKKIRKSIDLILQLNANPPDQNTPELIQRSASQSSGKEMKELQKSFEAYENFGRTIIKQSINSSNSNIVDDNNRQNTQITQMTQINQNSQVHIDLQQVIDQAQCIREIDLENVPQQLLPAPPNMFDSAIAQELDQVGSQNLLVVDHAPQAPPVQITPQKKKIRDEFRTHTTLKHQIDQSLRKKNADPSSVSQRDYDNQYLPTRGNSPLTVLKNTPIVFNSKDQPPSQGTQRKSETSIVKDLAINLNKPNKFNIQQLEEPSLRQMYEQSSREPLSGGAPMSSAFSESQPTTQEFQKVEGYTDERQFLRQMQRNRQKQILLSRKLMSRQHQTYVKQSTAFAYINQRPTSSKDALLRRAPFSKSIIDKRRENISEAIESTMKHVHQLNYDAHQIMLGDYRQLQISQLRSKSESVNSTCEKNMNISIKSTLHVGSDQVEQNSPDKESINVSPGLPTSPGLKSNKGGSMQYELSGSRSPPNISQEQERMQQYLLSAELNADMRTIQQNDDNKMKFGVAPAPEKQQEPVQKPVPPAYQLHSTNLSSIQKTKSVFHKYKNVKSHKEKQETEPNAKLATSQRIYIEENIPGGEITKSRSPQQSSLREQLGNQVVQNITLHDQLLLAEMRRQIEHDDEELLELYDDYSKVDNYKIDPVSVNKKLLKHFNKEHPLFRDSDYMHKRIMNEGYEIVKNLEIQLQQNREEFKGKHEKGDFDDVMSATTLKAVTSQAQLRNQMASNQDVRSVDPSYSDLQLAVKQSASAANANRVQFSAMAKSTSPQLMPKPIYPKEDPSNLTHYQLKVERDKDYIKSNKDLPPKENLAQSKNRIAIKPKKFDAELPYDHIRSRSSNLKALNDRIQFLYRSTEPLKNESFQEMAFTDKFSKKQQMIQQLSQEKTESRKRGSVSIVQSSQELNQMKSDKNLNQHIGLPSSLNIRPQSRSRSPMSRTDNRDSSMNNQVVYTQNDSNYDLNEITRHNQKSSQDLQKMLRRKSSAKSNKQLQASADHQYTKRIPFLQQNEMYQINNRQNIKRTKPDSSSGLELDVVATRIGVQRPRTGKLRQSSRNQFDLTNTSEQDYNCAPIQLATYTKNPSKDKINTASGNLMVVGQQDRPKERIHMHSLGLQVMNSRDQSIGSGVRRPVQIPSKSGIKSASSQTSNPGGSIQVSISNRERPPVTRQLKRVNIGQEMHKMSQLQKIFSNCLDGPGRAKQQLNQKREDKGTGIKIERMELKSKKESTQTQLSPVIF